MDSLRGNPGASGRDGPRSRFRARISYRGLAQFGMMDFGSLSKADRKMPATSAEYRH
jgi:hypothetical protein